MPVLKGRRLAGRAYLVTVGAPIVPPTQNPSLTLVSIVGQTPGGTSSATLSFANGAPAGLTATIDGAALSITGVSIRTISGLAETATGTATFGFVTPSAGSHTIVVSGVGTYRADTPPYTLTTVAPPSPATLTITGITGTVPGGTSTASLIFANGAPATITAKLDGADLTISGAFINASGAGSSASGNAGFSFVTPAAGSHTIVAHGTGTYLSDSNAYNLVTADVVQQPPGQGNSSATLTSQTVFDRFRVFNRDTYTGGLYGKGAGAVPVTVTPSVPVSALFMRLHDASDAAAQQNVVGSGAVLQPSTAVAGVSNLAATANTVNLTVPAGKVWYYVDLALDGAMTHPIRVPIPFGVGAVFGVGPGTSHGGGFVGDWAYGGQNVPPIDQMVAISPYGVVYAPNSANVGQTGAGMTVGAAVPIANTWQAPGNYGVSPYDTAWAAEFLRLAINRLGVNCGITGDVSTGGVDYNWLAPYDTQADHGYGRIITNLAHAGNKWEVQMALTGANDAGFVITRAGTFWLQRNVFDSLAALNKNPTMGAINGASPLFDTSDATDSWYWYHQAVRDLEKTRPRTVNNDWYDCGGLTWNVSGHTTMQSKVRMARQYYRYAMGLMGPAKGGFALRRGPSIVSGTRSGTTITLTVQHDGGTALRKVAWSETNSHTGTAYLDVDTSGKPDSDLAYLFNVYPAGNIKGNGGTIALAGAQVAVVNATTITLTLASDPGAGVALDVFHAMDFGNPTSGNASPPYLTILTDDTSDSDDFGQNAYYGRPMRRTIEPVFIPAPTPASQAITLDQPPHNPVSGGWCCVTWTGAGNTLNNAGTGLFASSVEFSVNGGAYAVGEAMAIRNGNKGSTFVPIPSSIAPGTSITIAGRRVGQGSPDSTVTVTVASARTELPDPDGTGALRSSAVANWDALNKGSLWQDIAKTVRSSHLQPVRVWADGLGDASNDITINKPEVSGCPWLDMRKRPYGVLEHVRSERPYVAILAEAGADGKLAIMKANNSNAARACAGSCTIFMVVDSYGGSWFALGNSLAGTNYLQMVAPNGNCFPRAERFAGSLAVGVGVTGKYLGSPAFMDYLTIRFDAATSTMTVRNKAGSVTTTGTGGPLSSCNSIWIGGTFIGQYGNVRAEQVVMFNRALSDAEITSLETWAAAKWPLQFSS